MALREQFLKMLWDEVVDTNLQGHWIDNVIRESQRNPNGPFADVGAALDRLLRAGASRQDLSVIARGAAYEAVFGTLYLLSDPGVDDNQIEMLHESLLSADPSGKEGRPQ
jgi:hypothetical protein